MYVNVIATLWHAYGTYSVLKPLTVKPLETGDGFILVGNGLPLLEYSLITHS